MVYLAVCELNAVSTGERHGSDVVEGWGATGAHTRGIATGITPPGSTVSAVVLHSFPYFSVSVTVVGAGLVSTTMVVAGLSLVTHL